MSRCRGSGTSRQMAGARRAVPPSPPHISRPVSRVLYGGEASLPRDGHSSGTPVTRRLQQPTRTTGPRHRSRAFACARSSRRPYSVLLPVGFAVPLPLPEARCALTAPFHPYAAFALAGFGGRSAFCGTFPEPPRLAPSPDVIRHRMSMEPGLSSQGRLSALPQAAVRPTDAVEARRFRVKIKQSCGRRSLTTAAASRPSSRPRGRRRARDGSDAGTR